MAERPTRKVLRTGDLIDQNSDHTAFFAHEFAGKFEAHFYQNDNTIDI